MRVAELMITDLCTIRGEDSLGEAVALMAERHVSGLPVVDPHGRLIGVLSSSDILQAEAEGRGAADWEQLLDHTLVREVMTPRPQTIEQDATVKEAAQRLLYLDIHRLFVEDRGRLVGVVSSSDLVRYIAAERAMPSQG